MTKRKADTQNPKTDTPKPRANTQKSQAASQKSKANALKRKADTQQPEDDRKKPKTDSQKRKPDAQKRKAGTQKPKSNTQRPKGMTRKPKAARPGRKAATPPGPPSPAPTGQAPAAVDSRDRGTMFLALHWSDGTEEWQGAENGPTPEMLDCTPEANGNRLYMRSIDTEENTHLEWRMLLAEALRWSTHYGRNNTGIDGPVFYLYAFPQGYRLYEHVNETIGGNPDAARDTYLYGHPKGPRATYSSPADFLPHLLWLAMDVTKNPDNCACGACEGWKPSPPPLAEPLAEYSQGTSLFPPILASGQPLRAPKQAPILSSGQVQSACSPPFILPPGYPQSAFPLTPFVSAVYIRSESYFPPILPSGHLQSAYHLPPYFHQGYPESPSLLPLIPPVVPAANLAASESFGDRTHDLKYPGLDIYRLGEMVWFRMHPHWALGIVIDVPDWPETGYKIQPLHSPLKCEKAPPCISLSSARLYPWVAKKPSAITTRKLNRASEVEYTNLPWSRVANSRTVEEDASIIKSRDVDVSFTLIDKLSDYYQYAGVYYGAERFWVGDAVRLKADAASGSQAGSLHDIFVVRSIYDETPLAAAGVRTQRTGVWVTGDLYRLQNGDESIPPPPEVPTAVCDDISNRSWLVPRTMTPPWTYMLVSLQITVRLEDVKGRWYPGSSLLQITKGFESFDKIATTRGFSPQEWEETAVELNAMGAGGEGPRKGYRRFRRRHEAFANAIPSDIVFKSLVQMTPPIEDNAVTLGIDPALVAISCTAAQQPPNSTASNMENTPAVVAADGNEGSQLWGDNHPVGGELVRRVGGGEGSFNSREGNFERD